LTDHVLTAGNSGSQASLAPLELPADFQRYPNVRGSLPGPRSLDLARRLDKYESPNITFVGGAFPVFWHRASGCYVQDVDGNVFLDFTSAFGVAGIGHAHPDVVAAIQEQSALLIHGMGDVHPSDVKADLLERIAARVPIPDAQVILSQNGSDAVEAAIKTARLATGKRGLIAFEGGYHGLSYGALDATARQDFRRPFSDQLGGFTTHLPFGCDIPIIGDLLAKGDIGAVLVEPIQGRGGIRVPPTGWLRDLAACCGRAGALLIADEIFTGWGRTGDWFACEHEGVVPDILCIGKAMGGGLPISACVAGTSLMSAWGKSRGEALHTSTFLGNPLACRAAIAAIGVMERENLPIQARSAGALLARDMYLLAQKYPNIYTEIRGRGLMLGLQIKSIEDSLNIVEECLQRGLILLPAGDGSVIELIPPLIVSAEEIAKAAAILDEVSSVQA